MQAHDVHPGLLRRLAGSRPGHGKVLSLYVDLDPTEFATTPARVTEVASLLDEADRAVREAPGDHDERVALREDLERVRAFLGAPDRLNGAHGLALFCSGPGDLFEVLRLSEPVPRAVVVDDAAWLEPLMGRDRMRWGVVLVSRRTLRAFIEAQRGTLQEVTRFADDVHRRHDQGGWSQARFQRGVEQEVDVHLGRAAEALRDLHRRRRVEAVAVGATRELCPRFLDALGSEERELVAGRFDVDVETASPDQVLVASRPVVEETERRELDELLDRVRGGIATGDRGAGGLEATLRALSERRVEVLLYESGFAAPGVTCAACGWLGSEGDACPACGAAVEHHETVLEPAIAAALAQSAGVRRLVDRPDLGPHGGIGAALRF